MDIDHKFWNKQPISDYSINNNKNDSYQIKQYDISEIDIDPFVLPKCLSWYDINLDNEYDLNELYIFLYKYYADNDILRFAYSKNFLKWFLSQQDNTSGPNLKIGIKYCNCLVGCIFAIPVYTNIFDSTIKQVEINLLCMDKNIRNFRLAPILINEITRRTHLNNIWSAIFSGSLNLPHAITNVNYYHRWLNIKKLLSVGFMDKPNDIPIDRFIDLYENIESPCIIFNKLSSFDCDECCLKLNTFLRKYKISRQFTLDNFRYHFIPKDDYILDAYVIKHENTITDFISYYYLSSSTINNTECKSVNKIYLYYYFNNKTSLKELVNGVIYLAKNKNIDAIDCIDILDYKSVFNELKFKLGNGSINYFFYNWNIPQIESNELGYFMV
jgi:glycylpeptide N-tetradecanoyltransferase